MTTLPRITLRGLIAQRRTNVSALARRVAVHRNTMRNWLRGKTEPSLSQAVALAKALDAPLDTIASAAAASKLARWEPTA